MVLIRPFIPYVSFSMVYPVVDHEFRHNNVKVIVDPRGVMTKFIVNTAGQTREKLTSIWFFTVTKR